MVKYWDQELCKVVTQFLSMPVCNIGTAQALFDAIESELIHTAFHGVMSCDTASDMVGAHMSQIREKQPYLLLNVYATLLHCAV